METKKIIKIFSTCCVFQILYFIPYLVIPLFMPESVIEMDRYIIISISVLIFIVYFFVSSLLSWLAVWRKSKKITFVFLIGISVNIITHLFYIIKVDLINRYIIWPLLYTSSPGFYIEESGGEIIMICLVSNIAISLFFNYLVISPKKDGKTGAK